ncbi:MAG: hypothetical protein ACRDZU_06185, partial [Acidimicrobiales bacterium]
MRRFVAFSGVVAVVAALAVPAGAATDRQRQIDRQITSLKERVQEASRAEASLLERLDDIESRRRVTESRLRELDAELGGAEDELEVATDELDRLQHAYLQADARFQSLSRELREAKRELRRRAVAAYVGASPGRLATVLLDVETPSELAAAHTYA